MADIETFRYARRQIAFLKKELATIHQRREELQTELVQKRTDPELTASIIGLDEEKEHLYASLIKHYEELIMVLEMMANIPEKGQATEGNPKMTTTGHLQSVNTEKPGEAHLPHSYQHRAHRQVKA